MARSMPLPSRAARFTALPLAALLTVTSALLVAAPLAHADGGTSTRSRRETKTGRPAAPTRQASTEDPARSAKQRARAAAAARDWALARRELEQAVRTSPGDLEARYLLGESERAGGTHADAIRSLRAVLEALVERREVALEARALASLATTYERIGELGQARETWVRLARLGDADGGAVTGTLAARGRIQAIDLVFEREHVYIGVRQRISDREKLKSVMP